MEPLTIILSGIASLFAIIGGIWGFFKLFRKRDKDTTGIIIPGDYNKVFKDCQVYISDKTKAPENLQQKVESGAIKPYDIPGTTLHNLPFFQNPFFTGREEMLKKLENNLKKSSSAAISQPPAISGLGGIGKTQIAVEYAYRHMKEYKVVLWVNSEEVATITASFGEIARALDLREKDEKNIDVVVEAVKSWLNANEKWLLIFDNADKPDIIRKYLPGSRNGHILITSRAAAFGTLAEALEVDEMASEEAVLFLLKRAKINKPETEDNETAGKIAKELGYLPLAIDQAGAFLEESRCSLNDYLESFREHGLKVLKDGGYSSRDYKYTVATTWSMSLDQLKEENPGAVSILHLCSFFAPDAIPFELIKRAGESFGRPLEDTVTDSLKFDRALSDLLKYSLVRRRPDTNQLDIHRLLQAVIRDELKQSETEKYLNSAVGSAADVLPDVEDYRNWSECEKLTPYILSLARHTESMEKPTEDLALLLSRTGYYLDGRADYEQAEPLYKRALEIDEKAFGTEHTGVAADLNNLASLYRNQGKNEQAEPLYKRSLEIWEKVLGPEHPDVATSLNNLAELYRAQDKYEQAEPLYKRALEIDEKVHGTEHPDVATDLNNLALLYYDMGKYKQAEPLCKRALETREKVLDPEHPDIANSLFCIGVVVYEQGRKKEGIRMLQRAYKIYLDKLGDDHPHTQLVLKWLQSWGVKPE